MSYLILILGDFVLGDIIIGDFVLWDFVQKCFCPRGLCPRGFCPRGFCPRFIDKCNYKTREAVRNNLSLEDGKPFKEIMGEILNTIVDHLETIFTNSNPRLSQMREVSVELSHVYPVMFHRQACK